MDAELEGFLADQEPLASQAVVWGEQMRLRETAYLSSTAPPRHLVMSVRAVVLRADKVLVQQDRDSRHILPGGRREGEEALEATLRREVREETGWTLGPVTPLGFVHFTHLDPKPRGYAYPHPHFCQCVYAAEATVYTPESKLDDGYEVGTEFVPITAVERRSLTTIERVFLEAALRIHGN